MFFPFDDTLVGYQEVVTVKTTDLPIPLFAFPKGSFFVDGTYGKIKGTNTILRPGLDYLVLSCNETIPFSSNPDQNLKLQQSYVRNAILLRTTTPMEIEWYVAYCGGEDDIKASEYTNYINRMYNEARIIGTTNQLLTPHQAWGGFLDPENKQNVSGKHIYYKPFRVAEENEMGGGLGWGKVELAVQALSESVTHGGDPAIIDAFFNWTKHNEIEFNKRKAEIDSSLRGQIANLDGKRIAVDQFMFKEDAGTPTAMNFVEHNNVMLRGLDPNQTETYVADPILTNRKDVGFYGLAKTGFDVGVIGTKLYQRKASATTRIKYGMVFSNTINTSNYIAMRVIKEKGTLPVGTKTLYIVSKYLGLIRTIDVTARLNNPEAIDELVGLSYPGTRIDYSMDTLTGYILDENMQGDFGWVGHTRVVINNAQYAFELDVINRGNLVGGDSNNQIDNVSTQFEVVIKRTYSINATTVQLRAMIAETGTIVELDANVAISVVFDVGEVEKRILITLTKPEQIKDKQLLMLYIGPNNSTIIASILVGLKSVGRQNYAQISLLNKDGATVNAIDVNNTYNLKVQFSKNADYFIGDLSLALTKLIGTTATAQLGEKNIVSNSVITYPITFSGTLDSVVSLGLTDIDNTSFKTNLLNIAYSTANVNPESPIFSTIVNGKHLRITRDVDRYVLDFAIEVKDHSAGGYVFSLSSNKPDLNIPTSVISNQGVVRFRATTPINKLESGTTRLTFIRAGQSYPLDFTVDIAKLIAIEIEYRDGAYSDLVLETGREFRIMLTNPFQDRKLVVTHESFDPMLGITDIVYGRGLSEIVVASLTLNPGERKQLTIGGWVSIESIKNNGNGRYLHYAPNCNIRQVLVSNSAVVKTGSYANEVGTIFINKEDYDVQAVNIVTGNSLYDHGLTENYIDVITQFSVDISNVVSAYAQVAKGYTVAIRNVIISPIDRTIITALTVKRNGNDPIDYNSIFIIVDYYNAAGDVVHTINTTLDGG